MGVCISKVNLIVQDQTASQEEHESILGLSKKNDYVNPVISPFAHAGFHPEIVVNKEEAFCSKVVQKLKPNVPASSNQSVKDLLNSWEKSGFLKGINNLVLSLPVSDVTTIGELAHSLTARSVKHSQDLKDKVLIDVVKAYSIYFWIINNISFDTDHWRCGKSPQKTLETQKGVSSDYSSLFSSLCGEVELQADSIKGNLRRWRSVTGKDFQPDEDNHHTWNSVILGDQTIILIDCMLGSGYVNSSSKFVKESNVYYFGVSPQHLILTHWPTNPSQQFLNSPLSLQTISSIIPVPIATLSYGIQPLCWAEVIPILESSPDPVIAVSFNLNKNSKSNDVYVSAKLLLQSQVTLSDHDDELQRCIYIAKSDNEYKIEAALATPGIFYLNIYLCSKLNDHKHILCLSYTIESKLKHREKIGYPHIFTISAEAFDFKPLHWNENRKSYVCINTGGLFSLTFESSLNASFSHYLVQGKVNSNVSNPGGVHRHNTLIVGNKQKLHKLLVAFPHEGWWTIYLAVTSEVGNEDTISGYTLLLNYHIYAAKDSKHVSYPRILLPHKLFFDMNPISATEHPTGESWEGFSRIDPNDHYDDENLNYYKLNILFPRPGTWFVHVFGKLGHEVLHKNLFELKITVEGSKFDTVLAQKTDNNLDINFLDNGIVSFTDGEPLSFKFIGPPSGIEFIQELKSPSDTLVDYCTILMSPDEDIKTEEWSIYTLNAIFPEPGKWTVEVYATKTGCDSFNLVLQVKLFIKKPIVGYCYPKIFPAFRNFNLNMLPSNALLPLNCSAELKLPFQAPTTSHFICRLQSEQTGDLQQYGFIYYRPDSQERILHLIFPEVRHWLLHLYAKQSTQEEYSPVLELSISNIEAMNNFSFPLLYGYHHEIYFDPNDLPLPSLVTVGTKLTDLVIKFYSHHDIEFKHYARVENRSEESIFENVLTRMMSNIQTGLHQLQVEVDTSGDWMVFLYAQSAKKSGDWMLVMQHTFSAVRIN